MNRHSARQTPQILADPKTGEPAFAVVPVADYEQLVADSEMLADVAAYDAATAADEESFPIGLLDRILAGDNRVRIYREHRKMTQSALAKAANLRQATISQIENGGRTGTVGALSRLARALDVDLENLAPRAGD